MSEWLIKKGNTAIQDIEIKDKDGAAVTNLADATEIKFQVKEKPTDETAKITKTKGDGIEVLTGDDLGKLRITLKPSDTNLDIENYVMGLEIKWSEVLVYEVDLTIKGLSTSAFRVEQDIIQ